MGVLCLKGSKGGGAHGLELEGLGPHTTGNTSGGVELLQIIVDLISPYAELSTASSQH